MPTLRKTNSFAIKTSTGSSKSNNMKSSRKSMRSCNWPTTNCCNNVLAIAASGTSRTPTSYGWTLATATQPPMRHSVWRRQWKNLSRRSPSTSVASLARSATRAYRSIYLATK